MTNEMGKGRKYVLSMFAAQFKDFTIVVLIVEKSFRLL